MKSHSLGVRARFALILVVLVPALLAVAGAAFYGLRSERSSASALYVDHVRTSAEATSLGVRIGDAHAAVLGLLLDRGRSSATASLTTNFQTVIAPAIDLDIATMRTDAVNNRAETRAVNVIADGWTRAQRVADAAFAGKTVAAGPAEVLEVESIFGPMTTAASSIVQIEAVAARASYQRALSSYASSVHLMVLVLVVGLVSAAGMVLWLIRSVLARTLSYSAFARSVSEGDFSRQLAPRGDDELDQLGSTLELLARRRQCEEGYDAKKLEFTDTLQLTENEQEAHGLLKRYLERAISNSTITILNRNNSADRLESVTVLPVESPLLQGLEGAKPWSCLAVRMARTSRNSGDADPLLACLVCSGCPGRTTCTPLLVGGEVIGSVLANHEAALSENDERSIREAVMQCAPVLGNLRNLAIAELRSATDTLTGLPNRRAIDDTLKRMVAESARSRTPLAALMCDLDHFKNVNDQYGHSSGDDLLAAVGVTLTDTMRATDFVGRYGGEEFLILLPGMDLDGACEIAQRVRFAVGDVRVPSVTQRVTMSVGIAVLPDDAVDAGSLERAADRALYAAKNAGRDRIEVFSAAFTASGLPADPVLINGSIDRNGL